MDHFGQIFAKPLKHFSPGKRKQQKKNISDLWILQIESFLFGERRSQKHIRETLKTKTENEVKSPTDR